MGKGGEGGGNAPPLRVKNKSPHLSQKNGYPSQKILDPFYSIPLFLGFFTVHVTTSIKLRNCSS